LRFPPPKLSFPSPHFLSCTFLLVCPTCVNHTGFFFLFPRQRTWFRTFPSCSLSEELLPNWPPKHVSDPPLRGFFVPGPIPATMFLSVSRYFSQHVFHHPPCHFSTPIGYAFPPLDNRYAWAHGELSSRSHSRLKGFPFASFFVSFAAFSMARAPIFLTYSAQLGFPSALLFSPP